MLRQQKLAAALLGTVVVVIAGYLSWLAIREAPSGEFVEGEHYVLIENPRRIRSDKIEVMEFFSYACVHCYNFDPILSDWVESHRDTVNFVQVPAVASEYWRTLGRNFLTYQQLGTLPDYHMPFFRAVHETRQVFADKEALVDFYGQLGGDRDAYTAAYDSPAVAAALNRADAMARRLMVATVPSIIVQGKYLVRTSGSVGPKRMLDVMDYLVAKELGEQAAEQDQGTSE